MDNKLTAKFTKVQSDIQKVESEIMEATAKQQLQLQKLQKQDAEIRVAVKAAMEANNVKKFENELLSITYVAPSKRKSLDAKLLKEQAPGIYDKYLKESEVASSIRIKVKD